MPDDDNQEQTGITSKPSPRSVAETASRLVEMVGAKGMKVFAVIDQAAEARSVGQSMRETVLVIFGSPAAGTPVMVASPLSAWTCRSRSWSGTTPGRRRSLITRPGPSRASPPQCRSREQARWHRPPHDALVAP